ncbi:MAG: hypothetical protein F7C34_03205 [Desulfurococcales archaeon]|nr:hypothetical protein [Desulfurococcales archaeon]
MNIKLLIVSLFVLTVISAVVGVTIYYSSLDPVRLLAGCTGVDSVLDKIETLNYTITDAEGNVYRVIVRNNPTSNSGTAELFRGDNLSLTIEYKYSTRLESITLKYPNGTVESYEGINASVYEEPFYTSLIFDYNQSSGSVRVEPFPGIGPVYLLCYVGKAADINWAQYASLRKPRTAAYGLVDVSMSFGKTEFKGKEYNSIVIQISRRGAITNKWVLPVYAAALIDYKGVPVSVSLSLDIPSPQGGERIVFQVTDVKVSG